MLLILSGPQSHTPLRSIITVMRIYRQGKKIKPEVLDFDVKIIGESVKHMQSVWQSIRKLR